MTNLNEYIQENRNYLGDSLGVLEGLTESQFRGLKVVTKKMGNTDVGIDNALIKSSEMIADFDSSRSIFWAERGLRAELMLCGYRVVFYNNIQMRKGQPRKDIAVVQFDDFAITLC